MSRWYLVYLLHTLRFFSQDNKIALDWINQNVYWIDKHPAARHIAMASMRNGKFTLLRQHLNNPAAIAVSPQLGYVIYAFFTAWRV